MNILFITRKHPPAVGGMEKLSFHLISTVSRYANIHKIVWGGSQKWLPFFIIHAFLQAGRICYKKNIDIIHLGDPVLSIIGVALKKIFNVPVAVTCHGLDLTHRNTLYQKYLDLFFSKLDKYICISRYTQELACKRISREKTTVIPVGIHTSFEYVQRKNRHSKTLITVGRLVKRKGVYWFLTAAFPKLPANYNYTIVGDGPEKMKITTFIKNNNLHSRVKLVTAANDDEVRALYADTDVFVMPNIHVKHDVEGFGLVALEAAATGLPVIASRVEGIADAIHHGKNGYLVPEKDSQAFKRRMETIDAKVGRRFSAYTRKNFSWTNVTKKYLELFEQLKK